MDQGVFGVHRGIWDHPLLTDGAPLSKREAWLWLVSEAAWKPRRAKIGSSIIELQRGQSAHSLRHTAKCWGWTVAAVRHFLSALKRNTMISTDSSTGLMVITVCNYDKYQIVGVPDDTASNTPCNTATTQQQHKEEEGKKERKEIEERVARATPSGEPARISTEAYKLADECLRAAGTYTDEQQIPFAGLAYQTQAFLTQGYDPPTVAATFAQVAANVRPTPPLSYFVKAVDSAHRRRGTNSKGLSNAPASRSVQDVARGIVAELRDSDRMDRARGASPMRLITSG